MGAVKLADFSEGVVLNEGDVTITGAEFTMWDYQGKRKDTVPALHLTLQTEEGEYEQFYSVGRAEDFVPTKDGKGLESVGSKTLISGQSNYAVFMKHLLDAGFPRTKMVDDDITCLVGTEGHVVRIPVKREGGGVQAETSVLVFDSVTALPGEGGVKTGKGKKAGGKTPDEETVEAAVGVVVEILGEGEDVPKKSLLGKALKTDALGALEKKQKTAVLNLLKSDDFLGSREEWQYEDGVLSIG